MNKPNTQRILLNLFMSIITLTVIGCNINIGGCCCGGPNAKFSRTEDHAISANGISTVDVDTCFGAVTVTGAETETCHIEAELTARAPSEEEAKQVAEQTEIKIETVSGTLKIFIEKPYLKNNRSVGVSFDIIVPKSLATKVHTSFGSVKLSDLYSSVNADTSFGSISCSNVTGSVDLKTSYGSIICKNIESENLKAHTSFGGVDIECSDQTGPELIADVSTSYGGIEFKAPAGFSGAVDARTSFGSIKTLLPITVSGEIGKDSLSGTVGTGKGRLVLKTSFGSIKIK